MLRRILFVVSVCAAAVAHAADAQKVILDVKGMTCASCPVTVKVVLKQQHGVNDVKMDADHNTAEVTFDPARIQPHQLAKAVTEAGYPATPRK